MTAPVTISGLSSGIDTNAVITSTLAITAGPQNALKTSLYNLQLKDASYQAVNTKLAAVKAAADIVTANATWQSTKATSSDPSIVATGSTAALAGTTTTFSVTALATAQTSTVSLADPSNASDAASGIDITVGAGSTATTKHITAASNSAADLVTAVNAANIGIKAALISTRTGVVLQFASTATGAANSFSVSGLTAGSTNGAPNALTNLSTAADASITVGSGSGSYVVDSATNTFANAIPGVTLTASALVNNASISISNDSSVASTAVQNLVSAMNSALLTISSSSGQGATLEGDSLVTHTAQQLLRAISGGSTANGKSFSLAGLDINSNGIMTFDSNAFAKAYTADSAGTQNLVTNLSASLSAIGDQMSNSSTGSLSQVIASDSAQEKDLTGRISDWDAKLADKKTALTNKYAAMEAALSKLKSQSNYLTQMFGANSKSSTSSSS